MSGRFLRVLLVLLGLAVVWVLPFPSERVGVYCTYDVWTWGLYGWRSVYTPQSVFGLAYGPVRQTYELGVVLSIAASVLILLLGAAWVRARHGTALRQEVLGVLVFALPAILLTVVWWWPDLYGINSGESRGYDFHRGTFGYLIEHRESYLAMGFPPRVEPITGPVELNVRGLTVTGVLSVVVVTGAGWLGSKLGRVGLARGRHGTIGEEQAAA